MDADRYVLGVDVGGTFTDLALVRLADGCAVFHKTSSTPADPSLAVMQGIEELFTAHNVQPFQVKYFGHGTTVATNAVITGRIARTGLITTQGFRDILEVRRQRQPHNYDIRIAKPAPIVPRHLRKEMRERVYLSGDPPLAPDVRELDAILECFRKEDVHAIAVCFLHSYAEPGHEALIANAVRQRWPETFVCTSHDVSAEFREYERISTTVLNAALGPVMAGYLSRLARRARATDLVAPRILQSSGGVAAAEEAGANAVRTLLSGPAAGVNGAAQLAGNAGTANIITFDVGGTSTDVCLIEDGKPAIARQRDFHGYPVRFPMMDVHSVGAGGGSVGWVDDGGFLHVGPQSAGADPGPACYDRGGELPTVTDANVVLGRLPGDALLGGRMPIRAELARKAIAERIALPMKLSIEQAAHGMLTILNENLIQAIRVISVEKGIDPRAFTLVAFGGAGPLLASPLAQELGIATILVPPHPGLLCAQGLLVADVRADFSVSRIANLDETGAGGLSANFAAVEALAAKWFEREGVERAKRHMDRALDLRYVGQSHELTIPVHRDDFRATDLPAVASRFREEHARVYGYAQEGRVQVVTYRITARTPVTASQTARPSSAPPTNCDPLPVGTRAVYFSEAGGFVDCPVFARAHLLPQQEVAGPAIVEQMDSTTVLLPDQIARADASGNLVLTFR